MLEVKSQIKHSETYKKWKYTGNFWDIPLIFINLIIVVSQVLEYVQSENISILNS